MMNKPTFWIAFCSCALFFFVGFLVGDIYRDNKYPCQQQKPEFVGFHYGQRVEIIDGFYKGRRGTIKDDYLEDWGYLVQIDVSVTDEYRGLHRELSTRIQPHEMLPAPPDPMQPAEA